MWKLLIYSKIPVKIATNIYARASGKEKYTETHTKKAARKAA